MRIGGIQFGRPPLSALDRTQRALARSLERLSSGRHVVNPRDDLAAYSLGVRLDAQMRGISQGLRNVAEVQAQAQSLETSLQSQLDLVHRMREIAVAATSETLTGAERNNLKTELQGLLDQYRRATTEIRWSAQSVQVGANQGDDLLLSVGSTADVDVFRKLVGSGAFEARRTVLQGIPAIAGGDHRILDINNDGILDVVTRSSNSAYFVTHLGRGDGTFDVIRTSGANLGGDVYSRYEVGDMNNDGREDIVAVSWVTFDTYVLLGNGDGTFQSPITRSTSADFPNYLRLRDMNNDGNLDVVYNNGFDVSYYTGNGTAEFSVSSTTNLATAGAGYGEFEILDLNHDNNMDLAVIHSIGVGDEEIQTYLGTGTGTMGSVMTIASTTATNYMHFADLNRDGNLDLVTVATGTSVMNLFIGTGSGSFSQRTTLTPPGFPLITDIASGDVNSDGLVDLVVGTNVANQSFVLFNQGTGLAFTQQTFGTSAISGQVSLVDLDGDGVLDIFHGTQFVKGRSKSISGLGSFDISSAAKAEDLLRILDSAVTSLETRAAEVTALHSRLDTTTAYQTLLAEDLQEARENSLNADLALETAESVRWQILQQAQTAVHSHQLSSMSVLLKLLDSMVK